MSLNFNPMERSSLMDLLTALQGGMQGGTAYGLLGDILAQQGARVDERQARLGSLTDLLSTQAMGGMPYEGAQALADAYTRGSNVPPRIEDVLGSLYPMDSSLSSQAAGLAQPLMAQNQGLLNQAQGFGLPTDQIQQEVQQMSTQPGVQSQISPAAMIDPEFAQQQALQQQMAPTIAGAFAAQAQAWLQPSVDAATGSEIPGLTPEQIIVKLVSSAEFQALPIETQAVILQAVQSAVQQSAGIAQAQGSSGSAPGAIGGGLAGAATGAAMGSAVLPGVGTVAGGLVGGLMGSGIGSDIGQALGIGTGLDPEIARQISWLNQ